MTTIKIIPESHTDHGVKPEQLEWALAKLALRAHDGGVLVETLTLPDHLGTVPNALIEIDSDDVVVMRHRGARVYPSRIAVGRTAQPSRLLTVIAGPHGDDPLVLHTAFGGPNAPKEPNDPALDPKDREASEDFWTRHALAELA